MRGLEIAWGVLSGDDLTGSEPSLCTNNDIALVYDKINDDYYVDVEIYHFRERDDAKEYLQDLLKQFAAWIEQRGEDPNAPIPLHVISPATDRFDTPFEAFLHFKALVIGFCAEEELYHRQKAAESLFGILPPNIEDD